MGFRFLLRLGPKLSAACIQNRKPDVTGHIGTIENDKQGMVPSAQSVTNRQQKTKNNKRLTVSKACCNLTLN
jgi:hypothetical protein